MFESEHDIRVLLEIAHERGLTLRVISRSLAAMKLNPHMKLDEAFMWGYNEVFDECDS